jgi:hypothetical protein
MFRKMIIALILTGILAQIVTAQDASPFEQGFLYRDGDQLMFVNPYVEPVEAVPLPGITLSPYGQIEWSPDGRYILINTGCLNLYDFDFSQLVSEEPIACNVEDAAFAHDSSRLVYSTIEFLPTDDQNPRHFGKLWVYDLENDTTQNIGVTDPANGDVTGFNPFSWSPYDTYLVLNSFYNILGGTINIYEVMNLKTGASYVIDGDYYAEYDVLCSVDEEWFLAIIKDEYATSSTIPYSNEQGDLYLFYAADGERFRLTFTPSEAETNIRWTEDGHIAYDSVQHTILSIDDVAHITAPPEESIISPPRLSNEDVINFGAIYSPDGEFPVRFIDAVPSLTIRELNGSYVFSTDLSMNAVGDPSSYIIGWRPAPAEPAHP